MGTYSILHLYPRFAFYIALEPFSVPLTDRICTIYCLISKLLIAIHYFIHDGVDTGNRVTIVLIDNPRNLVQDKVEKLLVEYILIFPDKLVCRALLAVLDSGIGPWAQVSKLRLQNSKNFLG